MQTRRNYHAPTKNQDAQNASGKNRAAPPDPQATSGSRRCNSPHPWTTVMAKTKPNCEDLLPTTKTSCRSSRAQSNWPQPSDPSPITSPLATPARPQKSHCHRYLTCHQTEASRSQPHPSINFLAVKSAKQQNRKGNSRRTRLHKPSSIPARNHLRLPTPTAHLKTISSTYFHTFIVFVGMVSAWLSRTFKVDYPAQHHLNVKQKGLK